MITDPPPIRELIQNKKALLLDIVQKWPLFQREPRMDADKVSFLAGNELPDAALIKTPLVANGEQGVPAKLKKKVVQLFAPAPASTTCIAPAPPCTTTYPLQSQPSIRMGRGEARAGPPNESRQGRQHLQHLLHPSGNSHVVITHLVRTQI